MTDQPLSSTSLALALAADHGGVGLKDVIRSTLEAEGYAVLDLGTHGSESVDYPDFADRMATALAEGRAERGILICGSGIGISIAANRYAHVRAALVHDAYTAKMGRAHNDANVLAMGARVIGQDVALDCVRVFLSTAFEGGRHQRRVDKMSGNKALGDAA